mmetsp:Transcript_67137/g.170258  ORF Transcript_67137/g.170258 Transcript_67137/m.170258 type:complete len:93 (-) Transcript_67137:77-355(-)
MPTGSSTSKELQVANKVLCTRSRRDVWRAVGLDGISPRWWGREFSVKIDLAQRFGTVDVQATTKESAGQEQDTQVTCERLWTPASRLSRHAA